MKTKALIIMLILGISLTCLGGVVTLFEFSQIDFVENYNDTDNIKKTYSLDPKLDYLKVEQIGMENLSIVYRLNEQLGDEINLYLLKENEPYVDFELKENTLTIDSQKMQPVKQTKNEIKAIFENLKDKKINVSSLAAYTLVIELNNTWSDRMLAE